MMMNAIRNWTRASRDVTGPKEWKPPCSGGWRRYATDWATIKKVISPSVRLDATP
jgi:hypothetical protein